MAVDGRRGMLQSPNFDEIATTTHQMSDIFAHGAANLIVVGTHKSSVMGRFGLTVEEDGGDAFPPRAQWPV